MNDVSIDLFSIVMPQPALGDQPPKDVLYNLELIIKGTILLVQFGLPEETDKFKNNYSLEKLFHKESKLSFFYTNIKSLKDEIALFIRNKQYKLKVFEESNFVSMKFQFNKFQNESHNFGLELFLYKTDSKHASMLVNQLSSELSHLEKENEKLRTTQSQVFEKLKSIRSNNKTIIEDVNNLYNLQQTKFDSVIAEIKENTDLRLKSLEVSVSNIKTDLINNGTELNVKNMQVYLPILRTEDKKMLLKWFGRDYELILAYDSIKHGDSSASFHSKCDGKVQTITLIETDTGRRFGGYSKLSWDSVEDFKGGDKTAFIFSLDKQVMLPINNVDNVIYCSSKSGPKFGSHDITISDEFTKNYNSYSCLLNSYGDKESYAGISTTTFMAGIKFFKVNRCN